MRLPQVHSFAVTVLPDKVQMRNSEPETTKIMIPDSAGATRHQKCVVIWVQQDKHSTGLICSATVLAYC